MNGYAPETVDAVSELDSVVVAVAPCGNTKLLPVSVVPVVVVVAVAVAVRLPVQLAPVGQQAMLSAESLVQVVPFMQQALEFPSFVQALYPLGQLSSRFRIRRTS